MRARFVSLLIAAAMLPDRATAQPAVQQQVVPVVEGFADLADLTLGAPVVLRGVIAKAERLNRKEAPDVALGRVRFLVTAKVNAVLVSPSAIPAEISYLWETPLDARSKAPKPKGTPVLLFLRSVPGRNGQFQLTAPQAQVALTAMSEGRVRQIISELRLPGVRDFRITGIANAFHVRGSVTGEAESQIFLQTSSGTPLSIVVLSRPGQGKTLSVATADIIDEATDGVPRNNMLWYRLACGLPSRLPESAVSDLSAANRGAAAADYRFVLQALAPCGRTLR